MKNALSPLIAAKKHHSGRGPLLELLAKSAQTPTHSRTMAAQLQRNGIDCEERVAVLLEDSRESRELIKALSNLNADFRVFPTGITDDNEQQLESFAPSVIFVEKLSQLVGTSDEFLTNIEKVVFLKEEHETQDTLLIKVLFSPPVAPEVQFLSWQTLMEVR